MTAQTEHTTTQLTHMKCMPCEGTDITPMHPDEIQKYLKQIPGWTLNTTATQISRISKRFDFKNYYKTMAFVNAVAWIAHQEGHHPDLEVCYNACVVHFTTHAVKGLTDNDFISAAKIDGLAHG